MALVVKAAIAMHWFGVQYAADDVIDTTGYDDRAMTQLLTTQPVYVSDPSGGSTAGAPVVRKFPFAFDTPGLVTGHDLYTPTIGDVLIDAWIEITGQWNGTTPTADVEQWALAATGNGGLFNGASNGVGGVDMTIPDGGDFADPTSLLIGEALSGVRMTEALGNATLALAVSGAALTLANMGNGFRYLPAKFRSASPVGVVVNETGKKGGTTAGATAGSAVLYLVTATPV